jgi:hypothetical protein
MQMHAAILSNYHQRRISSHKCICARGAKNEMGRSTVMRDAGGVYFMRAEYVAS